MGTTVPMLKKAWTLYHGGRTGKIYLFTVSSAASEAIRIKKFGPNVLPPIDLHTVMLTVTENNFGTYPSKATTSVLTAEEAHEKYGAARTFDGDNTKIYLLSIGFNT